MIMVWKFINSAYSTTALILNSLFIMSDCLITNKYTRRKYFVCSVIEVFLSHRRIQLMANPFRYIMNQPTYCQPRSAHYSSATCTDPIPAALSLPYKLTCNFNGQSERSKQLPRSVFYGHDNGKWNCAKPRTKLPASIAGAGPRAEAGGGTAAEEGGSEGVAARRINDANGAWLSGNGKEMKQLLLPLPQ